MARIFGCVPTPLLLALHPCIYSHYSETQRQSILDFGVFGPPETSFHHFTALSS